MATIDLPALPRSLQSTLTLNSKSQVQSPPFGGQKTRISRQGDYYTYAVTLQHMTGSDGSVILGILEGGSSYNKVRQPIDQDFTVTDQGSMVVNGAHTDPARLLHLRAVPGDFTFQAGQMMNIISNGITMLHRVVSAAPDIANANAYVVQINPQIKIPLADGDGVEFETPKIEGWITGSTVGGQRGFVGAVAVNYTIEEAL